MSQWQPEDPYARPPVIPPQFERRNERLPVPMHVQPQAAQPVAQPPIATRRRKLRPYPYRLVRFPEGLLPGSGRRRRGVSVWRIFYLGRHPIALLIELWLTVAVIGVVCAWIVLVALAWAAWTAAVTIVWLCQAAAAAMRR